MHENVRLSVERSRHSWSCPVKRLRPSGAERARAAMSGAPAEPSGLDFGDVGRYSAFEQPGQAISSALAAPSGLERPFRAPQPSRTGSSGRFERPSGAERARMSQTLAGAEFSRAGRAERSRLEQPFRAPQRSRAGSRGRFERPSEAERARSRKRRRSRASSSGHFERPSGAERARAAVASAPSEPSGLERPFRAPQRSRAGSMSQTFAGTVFSKPG